MTSASPDLETLLELDKGSQKKKRVKPPEVMKSRKHGSCALFFHTLEAMIGSGVPIVCALDQVAKDESDIPLARAAADMSAKLEQGYTLSQAMEAHHGIFSQFHCRLVEVGEASGTLVKILEHLTAFEERRLANTRNALSQIIHPVLVLIVVVPLALFIPGLVLQPLESVLAGFGEALPLPAQLLIRVSEFILNPYGLAVFILLLWGTVDLLRFSILREKSGLRRRLFRTPYVGTTLNLAAACRFAQGFSLQLRAGVNTVRALKLSLNLSGAPDWADSSLALAKEMENGATISETMGKLTNFPPALLHLIAAGEESGRVAATVAKGIPLMETELEYRVSQMTAAFQPVMMGFIGVIVGGTILSVMVPISRLIEVMA